MEFAKESRPRREREPYPDDRRYATVLVRLVDKSLIILSRGPRARRPPGIRILVQNVNRDVSWQVRFSFTIPFAWTLVDHMAFLRWTIGRTILSFALLDGLPRAPLRFPHDLARRILM